MQGGLPGHALRDRHLVLVGVLRRASTRLASMEDSRGSGERLGDALARPGLRTALVFGPGVAINGSALIGGTS